MSVGKFRVLTGLSTVLFVCLAARGALANEKKQQAKQTPLPHQSQVITVQAKGASGLELAEKVQQALAGKLDKLPASIRAAIKKDLQSIHISVDAKKPGSKPVVSARRLELKVAAPNKKTTTGQAKSATVKPRVVVMRVDDDTKHSVAPGRMVIAIVADKDGNTKPGASRAYTVQVKGDRVILNGKPVAKVPHIVRQSAAKAKAGKATTRSIKRHIDVRLQQQKAEKKETRRRMVWIDKDGKKHEMEVEVVVQTTPDGKTSVTAHADKKPAEKSASKPRVRARAMRLDGHHKPITAKVQAVPHARMQIHRVEAKKAAAEAKTHQQAVKELHGIQQELKKIRELLDQINKKLDRR